MRVFLKMSDSHTDMNIVIIVSESVLFDKWLDIFFLSFPFFFNWHTINVNAPQRKKKPKDKHIKLGKNPSSVV